MGRERLLLIDSCITKRIASALRNRGRQAMSLNQIGAQHWNDPKVLKMINDQYPDCVLVTTDDHMPEDHKELVDEYKPTLAIIDPKVGKAYDQNTEEEAWKWEVCMRWAHRMQEQEPHTLKRYNDGGAQTWKKARSPRGAPKRRKVKRPTGTAAGKPVVPKEDESHEQGQQGQLDLV